MASHKVTGHRAQAAPISKAVHNVAGRRANVEALNGGGFKTTLHHSEPSEQAMIMGRHKQPTEAAHKTYKAARKAMDAHMMPGGGEESGEPMSDAPEAQ